jgi:hypothetical protein
MFPETVSPLFPGGDRCVDGPSSSCILGNSAINNGAQNKESARMAGYEPAKLIGSKHMKQARRMQEV